MCNWRGILALLLTAALVGSSLTHIPTAAVTHFTTRLVRTPQIVVFGCRPAALQRWAEALLRWQHLIRLLDMRRFPALDAALSRQSHARTAVIVDCACNESAALLQQADAHGFFNKTYQWLLLDGNGVGVQSLLGPLQAVGANAQITHLQRSAGGAHYAFVDVHSKGRHRGAPLELAAIGLRATSEEVFARQGLRARDQFGRLTLRGATVIDQDDIYTNEDIERVLARPAKDSGVAAFTKYHYELLLLLRDRLNFTVNFRNARGWAGRLGNTSYRLGYLGIMQRNEADVGASAAFNRINRFAEFDIIHQSWKFETAFLYRFTPELDTAGSRSGNFLAPFEHKVWLLAAVTVLALSLAWRLVERLNDRWRRRAQPQRPPPSLPMEEEQQAMPAATLPAMLLMAFGAVCQQGMADPMPSCGSSSRVIILTIFLFTLIMYNYYTSVVVGGLLSGNAEGPATVDAIVSSRLSLAFEDIGYYKVLFRESKVPVIRRLIARKVEPARDVHALPVYAHINEALPYLKSGEFAFHCEVVDAYPEIARYFDANEICELRVVNGLLETEVMNWIVHKNSQYSELFRIVMQRIREAGLVERLLRQRQLKKPKCQALYTVYPVGLSGILSSLLILTAGCVLAFLVLLIECLNKKHALKER